MKSLSILPLAILASSAFADTSLTAPYGRTLQVTAPVSGTVTTLAGIVGVDIHTKKPFSAAVMDVKIYTFTRVVGFGSLDLHVFPGVGQSGRVAGGGSLGKGFQLADQVSGFFSVGLVSMQGVTGFSPHVEGGIVVRW